VQQILHSCFGRQMGHDRDRFFHVVRLRRICTDISVY
jgi:hypothetical protein